MSTKISALSNLQQRLIVGVLGAALFIGGIIFSEWTFFLLFLGLTLLGTLEFYKLVGTAGIKANKVYGAVLAVGVFVSAFLMDKGYMPVELLYLALPALFLVFVLEMYRKEAQPFTNIAFTILGVLYIAFPFSLLQLLGHLQGEYRWQPILGLIDRKSTRLNSSHV